MQIFQYEDQGLIQALAQKEPHYRLQGPLMPGLRIHIGGHTVGIFDIEQAQQKWKRLFRASSKPRNLAVTFSRRVSSLSSDWM